MKSIVALVMIGACIGMTLAFDASCNAKIAAFKDCHKQIRDQHEQDAKTKETAIEACYSMSSCTPPGQRGSKSNDADRQKKQQCMEDIHVALKGEMEKCVTGKVRGLTLPQDHNRGDDKGGRGGFKGGHGKKGVEQACGSDATKAAAVKACIKAHAGQGAQEPKARFDANCKSKGQCDAILGSCKASLDEAHKAICECQQQLHGDETVKAKLRASTPSCAGQAEPKQRPGGAQKPGGGAPKSCDAAGKKDPCSGTFEQWQAERKSHQGQRRPGDDGH